MCRVIHGCGVGCRRNLGYMCVFLFPHVVIVLLYLAMSALCCLQSAQQLDALKEHHHEEIASLEKQIKDEQVDVVAMATV